MTMRLAFLLALQCGCLCFTGWKSTAVKLHSFWTWWLHQVICHHDPTKSPLARMVKVAGHDDADPTLICFSDSAFMDNRPIFWLHHWHASRRLHPSPQWLSGIVTDSTAEAEATWTSLSTKAGVHICQAHCQIFLQDPNAPFAVLLFTNSHTSQITMSNDRDSS